MDILAAVGVVILVILFVPALIVRQGLRRELERLEVMLRAQAAELAELRGRLQVQAPPPSTRPAPDPPRNSDSPVSPAPTPSRPDAPVAWPAQPPAIQSPAIQPPAIQPPPRQPDSPAAGLLSPNLLSPNLLSPNLPAPTPKASAALTSGLGRVGREPAPPALPSRPGWSPSPRVLFAAAGALLTLWGLAAVLTQLARAGVFTPELQLLLAALLGTGLYALSPRASGAVRAALQGLGYGILALCMGALHQVGVLPAGAVLGLVLLLSALVGLHARHQEQVLGVAVALAGSVLSTWLLADNLDGSGQLLWAQLALTAVGLAAAGAALGSQQLLARLLVLALPIGVAGLIVVAAEHGSQGAPFLWTGLALLMAGVVLRLTDASVSTQPWSPLLPLGLLVTALLCAGPLAWSAEQGERVAAYALLALCAGLLGLLIWRLREHSVRAPDLLREALVASAAAAAAAWLGAALNIGEGSQRLIPLALALALYGRWSGSAAWRWGSALTAGALLLSGLGDLRAGHALLVVSALGSALAIGGRSGSLVAACAALVLTVWATRLNLNIWILTLSVLLAVTTSLALLRNLNSTRGPPLLVAALTALGTVLAELLGRAYPLPNPEVAASLAVVLTSAVTWWALRFGAAPLLGRLLPPGLAAEPFALRAQQLAEGAALGSALLALSWLLRGPAQTATLLAGVAMLVPLLRGVIPWPLVSLPLTGLALALSVSLPTAEAQTGSPTDALLSLLAASLALWSLGSLSGRRVFPLPTAARRLAAPLDTWAHSLGERGAACWGAVVAVLGSQFAACLARLFGAQGLLESGALPVTLSLLIGGIVMLAQGRERRSVPVWWTGLGFFAVASAKLVISDLDSLGTGARGVALALIGLMLLGVAQLAPQARPESEAPGEGRV